MLRVRLRAGIHGKARVSGQGRGRNLRLEAGQVALPVVVQLQVSNGECWSAFYRDFVSQNDSRTFVARPGSPSGAFVDDAPALFE